MPESRIRDIARAAVVGAAEAPTGPGEDSRGPSARTLSIVPMPISPTASADRPSTKSSARERLRRQVMLDAIVEAEALGYRTVVLTCGDAMLRWRDVLECISYATSLGLRTRVVCNACWARSVERAGQRLDVLVEHGLAEIAFTTGDEHARFVPWVRVVHAIAAALDRDLPVHVTVELGRERRVTRERLLEHPLLLERAEHAARLLAIFESIRVPLDDYREHGGRAMAEALRSAWVEERQLPVGMAHAWGARRDDA